MAPRRFRRGEAPLAPLVETLDEALALAFVGKVARMETEGLWASNSTPSECVAQPTFRSCGRGVSQDGEDGAG